MEENSKSKNNPFGELVNLIGVRQTASSNELDFYFVYLYSVELDFPDDDTPPDTPLTTEDKKILFCSRLDRAPTLYQRGRHDLTRWGECPSAPTASIDVVDLMDQLTQKRGNDYDMEMFYFLAILLDSVDAIEVAYPECYKEILVRLLSHQTASKQLDTFFEENEITREEVLDAVDWCIESIASNCVCINE